MSQMKASDFDPRVLKLFDGYVHGIISRRNFLDREKDAAIRHGECGRFTRTADSG